MEFKPMQPPENFDLWLLEYNNKTIKNIYIEIAPCKKYVPNFEYFVYNFFDFGFGFIGGLGGFFENLSLVEDKTTIKETNFYLEQYICTFNEITKDFSNIEIIFYYKILENYFFDLINSTQQNTYYYEYDVFIDLHKYFELKYNQNKHILPFTIHDKKNINVVNDENPDLSWFIANKTPTATAPEPTQPDPIVKWHGTQIEFIELVKSLIETGILKGTQKDIFEKLEKIFDLDIPNLNKRINELKIRKNGSETLFLDKLKNAMNNYLNK